MLSIFLQITVIILALFGLTELVKTLRLVFFKPCKLKNQFNLVVPNNNNIEYSVRTFAENIKWNGCCNSTQNIVITDGLSTESLKVCKKLLKEYNGLNLLTVKEFVNILERR